LQNNQFGILENLGDRENVNEHGKDPGTHSSKGSDRHLEKPIISSKENKKKNNLVKKRR
jgi:hypothetical protein